MLLPALKHLVVGFLLVFFGMFGANSNNKFVAASEPAQLLVYKVESRRNSERQLMFQASFALVTDKRPQPTYKGGFAASLPIHHVGEVVAGRYDAATGRMQSDRVTAIIRWLMRLMQLLGVIAMVQSVFIRMGMPEILMPLRVRVR
jgi:hypothetical protein